MRKSRTIPVLVLSVAFLQAPPASSADNNIKKRNDTTPNESYKVRQPPGDPNGSKVWKHLVKERGYNTASADCELPALPEGAQTRAQQERGDAALRKQLEATLAQPNITPQVRKSAEDSIKRLNQLDQYRAAARAKLAAQKAQSAAGKEKWNELVSFINANQEEESLIGNVVSLSVPAPNRNLNPNEITEATSKEGINCRLKWSIRLQAQRVQFSTPQVLVTGTIDSINWENKTVTINVKSIGAPG